MILDKVKPHTPAWHKQRALGVGASESPCLYNVQAGYSLSEFTLSKVKRKEMAAPIVDSDLAMNGLIMEPAIGKIHAIRQGWKLLPGCYAVDDYEPRMRASLDFVIEEPNDIDRQRLQRKVSGPGTLQIKSIISPQWHRLWREDEVPEYVRIQVRQEMACAGHEWGCVGALVGGLEPKLYWITPADSWTDGLRRRIDRFWRECVEGTRVPRVDNSESTRLALRVLQPDREFRPGMHNHENDPFIDDLCTEYDSACANFSDAEANKRGAENRLIEALGPTALEAMTDSWWIKRSVGPTRRTLQVTRRKTAQHGRD